MKKSLLIYFIGFIGLSAPCFAFQDGWYAGLDFSQDTFEIEHIYYSYNERWGIESNNHYLEDTGINLGLHTGYMFNLGESFMIIPELSVSTYKTISAGPVGYSSFDSDSRLSFLNRFAYKLNSSLAIYALAEWSIFDAEYTNPISFEKVSGLNVFKTGFGVMGQKDGILYRLEYIEAKNVVFNTASSSSSSKDTLTFGRTIRVSASYLFRV